MAYDDPLMASEPSGTESEVASATPVADTTHGGADNLPMPSDAIETHPTNAHGSSRIMTYLPKSVADRFSEVVRAERRQYRVVMQRALEEFLSERECEPRPYIPSMLKIEERVGTQTRIEKQTLIDLEVRADVEERNRNALVIRAVLNYLERHEGAVE